MPEPEPEVRFKLRASSKLLFAGENSHLQLGHFPVECAKKAHLLSNQENLSFLVNDVNGRQP